MNDFKGMNKQFSSPKAPPGTWEYAKGILLSEKYTSIANEKGSKKVEDIEGVVIGEIVTNRHIIYFSTNLEYSIITIKSLNIIPVFSRVLLRTKHLNFQIDCPIEGIYYYNYKNELIIGWVDGVFDNSNPPYLLNTDVLPFELDNNKELINPLLINHVRWFPEFKEPKIDIDYSEGSSLNADVIYVGMTYCFDDETEVSWSTFDNIAYIRTGLDKPTFKNLHLSFSNFDDRFKMYKIGLIVKRDNATFAYVSKYPFEIENNKNIVITSFENYEEVNVENLVFEKQLIEKANTLTLEDNVAYFGNVITPDEVEVDLQKYVNRLNLGVKRIRVPKKATGSGIRDNMLYFENHPSLLPNEVYSFKLKGKYKNGAYSPSFHIPNNLVNGTNGVDTKFLVDRGLTELTPGLLRIHHIENTAYKTSDNTYEFGSYFSRSLYPNKDNYNSSDLGGEDLRGTPIRYHRVPGLNLLSDGLQLANCNLTDDDPLYMFFPYIKNLEDVIPQEYLDLFDYFTLEITKRSKGNSIVDDTVVLLETTKKEVTGGNFKYSVYSTTSLPSDFKSGDITSFNNPFGITSAYSYQIAKNKYTIPKNTILKTEGFFNIMPIFLREVIEESLSIPRKEYFDSLSQLYLPTKGLIREFFRYSTIASYKYIPSGDVNQNTRFVENKLFLYLNSSRTTFNVEDSESEYFYNPLRRNNVYGNNGEAGTWTTNYAVFNNTFINSTVTDVPYSGPNNLIFPNLIINYSLGNALVSFIIKPSLDVYPSLEEITETVTIGKIYHKIENTTKTLIGGDVFVNTLLNFYTTSFRTSLNFGVFLNIPPHITRRLIKIYGIYSTSNNAVLASAKSTYSSKVSDTDLYNIYITEEESSLNLLNSLDFEVKAMLEYEGSSSSLNDLVVSIPYDRVVKNFINDFPFRILQSNVVNNESLSLINIRQIRTDNYYDMPNDKGAILALRSLNRTLYIQQMFSLFISQVKDSLSTNNDETVYLGTSTLLDRLPTEIIQNGKLGYIGCQSKFACKLYRDGLIVIDSLQGKIFIINKDVKEVSINFMRNYYKDNLDTNFYNQRYIDRGYSRIDNPYLGFGYTVTFDNEYERILVTKNHYKDITKENGIDLSNDYDYNGEVYIKKDKSSILPLVQPYFEDLSETWSISTEQLTTVCTHDYKPNSYYFTAQDVFYIKNRLDLLKADVFELNSNDVEYGVHDEAITESYVDLLFNNRIDLSKLYQAVSWVTEVVSKDGVVDYNKTLDKIMLYNDYQCSGIIELEDDNLKVKRNKEGIWQFNEFRDLLVDTTLPITNLNGLLNTINIDINKPYYEKSNFISNFIVVRVYFKNGTNNMTLLHNINVKSIISKR